MKAAYYNELDAEKAEVIREAIAAGLIAPGDVDTRSITEVQPEDVRGYTQCHFFAGMGIWSYALRLAGWPDDRPVWTGSCPCPSFSCAGKGEGFDDARHLWPDWFRLIRECAPASLFGEQSHDAIGYGWLDLVQANLEAEGYAVGKAVLNSASVGATDIRHRLYFGAVRLEHAERERQSRPRQHEHALHSATGSARKADRVDDAGESRRLAHGPLDGCGEERADSGRRTAGDGAQGWSAGLDAGGELGGLADTTTAGLPFGDGGTDRAGRSEHRPERLGITGGLADTEHDGRRSDLTGRGAEGRVADGRDSATVWLADTDRADREARRTVAIRSGQDRERQGRIARDGVNLPEPFTHALNGYWRAADWLFCTDGKWRPARPGSFVLAHGHPARVLGLRCAGDAINPHVAAAFIESLTKGRIQ